MAVFLRVTIAVCRLGMHPVIASESVTGGHIFYGMVMVW